MTPEQIEAQIPEFEGLIFQTATLILDARRELDRDDIQQRLRIKVWRGLASYDPERAKQPIRRYVFSCVMNEKKDIIKARRRREDFIEDIAPVPDGALRDQFELRYLSIDAERAFEDVEGRFELPSTLTTQERQVIGLLYEGAMQIEVREILEISTRALYDLLATIREKMADWRPAASERAPGPTPPLPRPLRAQPDAPVSAAPQRGLPADVCAPTAATAASA